MTYPPIKRGFADGPNRNQSGPGKPIRAPDLDGSSDLDTSLPRFHIDAATREWAGEQPLGDMHVILHASYYYLHTVAPRERKPMKNHYPLLLLVVQPSLCVFLALHVLLELQNVRIVVHNKISVLITATGEVDKDSLVLAHVGSVADGPGDGVG